MMYAKKANVLDQFEKRLKEDTRDDSDADDKVIIQKKASSLGGSKRSCDRNRTDTLSSGQASPHHRIVSTR